VDDALGPHYVALHAEVAFFQHRGRGQFARSAKVRLALSLETTNLSSLQHSEQFVDCEQTE
jgi:hypothetical protein